MITLDKIISILNDYKRQGYILTHRAGPTGIGKTLEDILGIEENNIDISNTTFAEIKSSRKNAKSMLTLFTKAPSPPQANSILLNNYGYITPLSNGKKILHSTVWTKGYNTLKGNTGFKIQIDANKVFLISSKNELLGFWDEDTLRNCFEKKLHHVLFIRADSIDKGINEKFWFNEAWLLTGFNFTGFINALKDGLICVDIRIGQYPDCRPHDHGTGFRIFINNLDQCFIEREQLL